MVFCRTGRSFSCALPSDFCFYSLLLRADSEDRPVSAAETLRNFIVAGAAGNLIDRIRLGYVVDFFYFRLIDFPGI